MQHLPVGINTLDKIRCGGFVYVDKTEYAYRIAHKPDRAQPCRLGWLGGWQNACLRNFSSRSGGRSQRLQD
ncbi:hypothetical protein [Desulfonatronum parangueonense]